MILLGSSSHLGGSLARIAIILVVVLILAAVGVPVAPLAGAITLGALAAVFQQGMRLQSEREALEKETHMSIDRKRRGRLFTALPILAIAATLAACGAAVERPTDAELSAGLDSILKMKNLTLTNTQLQCFADELLDSEIPDQDLANIADGKDEQTSEESYTLIQPTIATLSQDCASQ